MKILFPLRWLTGVMIICMANVSCKKETPPPYAPYTRFPPPLVKLNPEGLEFVQLPPGRYFAYKDSTTGLIDTVYVSQSSIEKKFQQGIPGSSDPNCAGICQGSSDYYYQEYTLRLSRPDVPEWFKGVATTGLIDRYFYRSDSVFISPDFSLNDFFWYPFNSSGQALVYDFIQHLQVGGVTYFNVHVFSTSNGLQPADLHYYAKKIYWVKGIGIVQKEIRRFNSVQTHFLLSYW